MNPVPIYEMFPFIKETGKLATDLSGARVISASINQVNATMDITVTLETPTPPYELTLIKEMISKEFGIKTLTLTAKQPQNTSPAPSPSSPSSPSSPFSLLPHLPQSPSWDVRSTDRAKRRRRTTESPEATMKASYSPKANS